ncbi:MAG: SDR family NAD(P)-dependent oxidoreductase [Gammaproteobacteria bacterium]|nr:SDR family NAD(P)-dependent oxidoreductase [Gammaproteobacteria bacterium]MBQ0838464.1 SDR family NAD(P)-dependent oxidoreductase [Gammaproteobacteria bacterium]
MRDLAGKVAFITGGASGMGLGMARAFAGEGMKLMLADVNETRLAEAEQEFKDQGVDVATIVCDVTKRDQVFAAADATVERFGKVHVLCNNAGINVGGTYEELSQQDWDWVIAVNQLGVQYGISAFLPKIKEHGEGGHIVTTSSMAGMVNAGPGWAPYNASKFAVVVMNEVLFSELKGTNIGVSVLCPGAVATNIIEAADSRPEDYGSSGDKPVIAGDVAELLEQGLDPDVVGKLVLEGIQEEQFYLFTDPRMIKSVERRFERIQRGFDWSANSKALVDASAPGSTAN